MSLDNEKAKMTQATVEAEPTKKPGLGSKILSGAMRYGLPLALTVLLVYYIFRKVNFGEMMDIIRHGVNYFWILAMMTISVFSHIFRALRWKLQLRALDINVPTLPLCCSIFGTYALNLVLPRLGEVWRCTYIARRQHASFTKVLGSMVADRLSDTLMVLFLLLFTFVVASAGLNAFLDKYPVGRGLLEWLENPWFWLIAVGAVGVVVVVCRLTRRTKIMRKLSDMLLQMWKGFAVVATMPGRGRFLALTLCIWGCYFFQLYAAFYAFPFTRELVGQEGTFYGLIPCLVAFVLSSISMAIPSNGGLGPWNIAVIFGLAVYGIGDAQGTAFSMLVWSAQTVMLILLGIFTMAYISTEKTTPKPHEK